MPLESIKKGGIIMISVEILKCKDPIRFTGCKWKHTGLNYPDKEYNTIKAKLPSFVRTSKQAYRLRHNKLGLLFSVKLSRDGSIFSKEYQTP